MQTLKKIVLTFCLLYKSLLPASEDNNEPYFTFDERLQQLSLEEQESKRLHDLFDLYWDWIMAMNPDYATYLGYPGRNDQWPNLSLDALQQQNGFVSQILQALTAIHADLLSKEDLVSYTILKRDLEAHLASSAYHSYYMPINQMHGIHLDVSLIISLMPAKTVEDYEDILSRLNGMAPLIDQVISLMDKGLEAQITPPKIALRHVPEQVLNQMTEKPLDSVFLKAFTCFPDTIPSQIQTSLIQKAEEAYRNSVYPALDKLYSYLIDRYIPNCRKSIAFSELPSGKEWYALKVQQSTTTNLSPEQIHQIGLAEVQRIYQEMLAIINDLNFEGSFADFLLFLKTDDQFFYKDREGLLDGYRTLTKQIEARLPLLFGKLPKLPYEVVPIPAYSEESQIAAYYCHGSVTHQRPGYFFINTSYPQERPKWEMEPLALHEAIPGHHLQIALAQELEGLPEFRKNTHYTAFIEGWGLYAEGLGVELGFYQDPYSQFGRLTYEMLRAIRLVVDTGMHTMGWSRDQAIEFFKQYVSMSEHEIVTEVDRYLVMPAQALAYKIGELKIKELRQLAAARLGERFNIRDFHDEWLSHGTLPLDVAESLIHEWINSAAH